jgi:hypothetical protein
MKKNIPCIVMLFALFVSTAAFAEETSISFTCPERPEKVAKARKQAGVLFTEAEDAFDNEKFEQALERFVCSMVMVEHENTVTNIERTLEKVEDKSKALTILQTYTALRPNGDMKAKMDEIIAAVEASIAPPKEADTAPPCPEVKIVEPPPCPVVPNPALEIEFKNRAQKLLLFGGWTAAGVGAASFIAAIIFQAMAASTKNHAQEAVRYEVFLDERDKNQKYQVAAATLFVSSVLAAGVGVAELVLLGEQQRKYNAKKSTSKDKSKRTPSDKSKVSVVPGIGGLEVRF